MKDQVLLNLKGIRKTKGYGDHELAGLCYVASEALYHLEPGTYKPFVVKLEDGTHWFLKTADGEIVDLTAEQFNQPVDYSKARGVSFLTTKPSKRAQIVIDRVTASDNP